MDLRASLQTALGSAYVIERELGGGMSRVFVARDAALGRRVVVKVLPPELASAVSGERFHLEIQVAAQLQHPHIVPLLSAGHQNELTYYTMPYVEGESLRARLDVSGEMPVGQAVRILRDVAAALTYAHKHGVVHRDIKPDNVLLSDDYAMVTDFGVAKAVRSAAAPEGSGLTSIGVALGTPAYMAPEQAAAEPNVDHRADIYALGVLAYELLTGASPFAGRSASAQLAAHVSEMPVPVSRRRPSVPAPLAQLVERCLEKRPADRPQSADEIARALDAIAATPPGTAPWFRLPWRPRRRALAATGIVAVTLAAVALAVRAVRSPARPTDDGVIAVFPFRVASAHPTLQYLREGMPDLLSIKLPSGGAVRTSDVRAVMSAVARAGGADLPVDKLSEIAASLGAGQLMTGEVIGTPAHVVISAMLRDFTRQRDLRASVQGSPDSITHLVDALAAQLLALRADISEDRLASLARTPLPALRAYLDGQASYRHGHYQAAAAAYARALEVDSTFASAAVGRVVATSWLPSPAVRDSARARAWPLRDRMTKLERLRMEAQAGARTPGFTPHAELLRAAEQFAAVAPDNPEAWFVLGDKYFHHGAQMGYTDALARALSAFNKALALDSTFMEAAEHLPLLYGLLGDPTGVRRATAHLLALDSLNERVGAVRWYEAAVTGDVARMRAVVASPRATPLIFESALHHGIGLDDAERRLVELARDAITAPQRRTAGTMLRLWNLNAGRPRAVANVDKVMQSDTTQPDFGALYALHALFWDGDSTQGALGATNNARQAKRLGGLPNVFLRTAHLSSLAFWEVEHGRLDEARRVVEELRAVSALPDTLAPMLVATAQTLVLALDALLADREQRTNAAALLARLDSAARTVPAPDIATAVANLTAARLWEKRGNLQMALQAVRRRSYHAEVFPPFLTTFLREEGRLAEATGDREGAIRAYSHYLALRHSPEPELRADAERVARILARLKREGAGS